MARTFVKINPKIKPEKKNGYILPFSYNDFSISQGYNGPFSHFAISSCGGTVYDWRYCIDFAVPVNTDVLASKEGKVVYAIDDSQDVCREKSMRTHCGANLIILEHEDNTKTLYSHLNKGSVSVNIGDLVKQGKPIAKTGLSGWIGYFPHLHFCAFFHNDKGGYQSFPVEFCNYKGNLNNGIFMTLKHVLNFKLA